jgi:hypothetical protein
MKHVDAGNLRLFAEFLVEKSTTLQTTPKKDSGFPSDFFSLFLTLFDFELPISLASSIDTFVGMLRETMTNADWTNLDLSVLFRILLKIVQREGALKSTLTPLMTPEMIVISLSSTANSYDFFELLDFLMDRRLAVKSLVPVVNWDIPPRVLARVFQLTVHHHPASLGAFVDCLAKQRDPFLVDFVEELSLIKDLLRIMKSFIIIDWIPILILRQSSALRSSTAKLIQSFHLDGPCYHALFDHLMRQFGALETLTSEMIMSQGLNTGMPTDEFFSLLTWTIAGGKLQALARDSAGEFMELMAKFRLKGAKICEKHILKCILSFASEKAACFLPESDSFRSLYA